VAFWNIEPDEQLRKYMVKHINKRNIYPISLECIVVHCGTNDINDPSNVVSVYEVARRSVSSFKKEIDKLNKFRILKKQYTTTIIADQKMAILLFDNRGYQEVGEVIWEGLYKNSVIRNNIDYIRRDLTMITNNMTEEFKDVIRKYPTSIETTSIGVHINITPKVAHFGNKTIKVPKNKQLPIKKLKIKTNPQGEIISILLDNRHCNADKHNYYCLGDDKFKHLNLEYLEHLISRISIYNLNDCYWHPDYIKIGNANTGGN